MRQAQNAIGTSLTGHSGEVRLNIELAIESVAAIITRKRHRTFLDVGNWIEWSNATSLDLRGAILLT